MIMSHEAESRQAKRHLWQSIRHRLDQHEVTYLDYSAIERDFVIRRQGSQLRATSEWLLPALQAYQPVCLALLLIGGSTTFLPVFWSCLQLSIPAFPLPFLSDSSDLRAEAERIVASYGGGRVLVVYDDAGLPLAKAIRRCRERSGLQIVSVAELCTAGGCSPISDLPALDPSRPAYLLETSGTTGEPKAACFSGAAEASELATKAVLWLFPAFSSSGISSAFALNQLTIFWPLYEAIRSPDRLLALMDQHKLTSLSIPPVLLSALLRYLREPSAPLKTYDLSSLVRLGVGSAACSYDDCLELQQRLTAWGFQKDVIALGYGLTETGLVAWGPFRPAMSSELAEGETLIGPVIDGVDVKIEDQQLYVRSEHSFLGYLKSCSGDSLVIDRFESGQDWFGTGDLARLAKHQLVLCGRAKDILIVNSRKVSLAAIESSVLKRFKRLFDHVSACALPPTDQTANEGLLLVCAPTAALSAYDWLGDELDQQVQAHVAEHFGVSVATLFRLAADQFPRTSTGKIRKADLSSRFQQVERPLVQAGLVELGLEAELLAWIRRTAPMHLEVQPEQKLSGFGVDSLALASMIGDLERRYRCRCRLEECPPNPTIAELLALFDQPAESSIVTTTIDPDPRSPQAVMLRAHYEQMLRSANLQSTGQPVGLGQAVRLHNPSATGVPLVLLSAWPSTVVADIARHLPEHPIYFLRCLHDYGCLANHRYLQFCMLEWLESCVASLGMPVLLAANCRAALHAVGLAELMRERQLPVAHLFLAEWDSRFSEQVELVYPGTTSYHLHADHHGSTQQEHDALIQTLSAKTPRIGHVILANTQYDANYYSPEQHPMNVVVDFVHSQASASAV